MNKSFRISKIKCLCETKESRSWNATLPKLKRPWIGWLRPISSRSINFPKNWIRNAKSSLIKLTLWLPKLQKKKDYPRPWKIRKTLFCNRLLSRINKLLVQGRNLWKSGQNYNLNLLNSRKSLRRRKMSSLRKRLTMKDNLPWISNKSCSLSRRPLISTHSSRGPSPGMRIGSRWTAKSFKERSVRSLRGFKQRRKMLTLSLTPSASSARSLKANCKSSRLMLNARKLS